MTNSNRARKDAFMLRFDEGLREQIKVLASKNSRSMTAEINHRLAKSLEEESSENEAA